MSHAIYLSPKAANKSALIFIQTNSHNPKGWIEKPSGKAVKLHQRLSAGGAHERDSTRT